MAAAAEMDSGTDSVSSTPRSIHNDHHHQPRVRLMCSFGGKILPRPHDNQLRYVGGDTRIVVVNRSTTFAALVGKLAKLTGAIAGEFTIKYQLPNEDLDALITVSADEDVENMMEEWERVMISQSNKNARLRLFLFPITTNSEDSRASSISSLLDGSTKRESWFLDALNGGRVISTDLERGRSEASSIVSEVPDYLFGLDNPDDPTQPRMESRLKNNRFALSDNIPGSDPGSPAPVATAPSPFCSSSSAPASMPLTPNLNLPPVKTKPESPVNRAPSEPGSGEGPVQHQGVAPVWTHPHQGSPYPGHAPVQHMPIYYVTSPNPSPNLAPPGPGQVHPMQVQGPYVHQYQIPPGQVPMGYQAVPGAGQMYSGAIRPQMAPPDHYQEMQGRVVSGGPIYYGIKGGAAHQPYPGMVVGPGGESGSESGPDGGRAGRV